MKRKASFLDESAAAADWSPLDYSSSSSTTSPESVKAFSNHHSQTNAHWHIGTIPYLNSRTRKRYRDDRPNEETVHSNTIAKLFNAQRNLKAEEYNSGWQIHPTSSYWNQEVQNPTPNIQLAEPERNQRSIDSFFGGGSRGVGQQRKPQPSTLQFSTVRDLVSMALRCEDCNTTLQPANSAILASSIDAMGMDLDPHHDEWACASCSRQVCDTCAVRGDRRICLECAIPGG